MIKYKVGDKVKINSSCAYGPDYLSIIGLPVNQTHTVELVCRDGDLVKLRAADRDVFFLPEELNLVFDYNIKDWSID